MPDTQRCTVTPGIDQWSVLSGTIVVDRPESPHLYTFRRQYKVATGRTLGSLGCLDTDVSHSPGSMSSASSPPCPKSMAARAKEQLTPRTSKTPPTPDSPRAEKSHGAFCRTKSVVKSLRRGSNEAVIESGSRDSLRSGFYSKDEMLEISGISDEPPQVAQLTPGSRFLPDLTIFVTENDAAGNNIIVRNSIEDKDEVFSDFSEISYHISSVIAPHHPRSSSVSSRSLNKVMTAETIFYTAGETSFYYTPAARDDNDVFADTTETSRTRRLMTAFMAEMQEVVDSERGYKTPSIVSSEGGSAPYTPSPSPKLRHSPRYRQLGSLRAQYSKTEPASSVLAEGVPKMWHLNEKESTHNLRVAPSLEDFLHTDSLEVFEDNATAEATPIIRVEPGVVNIRRSEALSQLESRDVDCSNQEESDSGLISVPLPIKPRPARVQSGLGLDYDVSTMPIETLRTIVFSAAYGDAKCIKLASGLYAALKETDKSVANCEWRRERLLEQAHLLAELKTLRRFGFLCDEVFGAIRSQIFPTETTELMGNEDFKKHIRGAVGRHALAEDRAEEVLNLTMTPEDQGLKQTSPEDEVFYQREPFNGHGFVYDASSSDERYEHLGSLPSTVGTSEQRDQPEPEPRWTWWRSPVTSKLAGLFRIGYRKPMV